MKSAQYSHACTALRQTIHACAVYPQTNSCPSRVPLPIAPQLPASGHPVCGAHLCVCEEPAHPLCHARPRTQRWAVWCCACWMWALQAVPCSACACLLLSWHSAECRSVPLLSVPLEVFRSPALPSTARPRHITPLCRSRRSTQGGWRPVPLPHGPPVGRHAPACRRRWHGG